jgi:hypothetical protein
VLRFVPERALDPSPQVHAVALGLLADNELNASTIFEFRRSPAIERKQSDPPPMKRPSIRREPVVFHEQRNPAQHSEYKIGA